MSADAQHPSREPRSASRASTDPGPRSLEGRALVFGEVLFDHFPDGSSVLGGAPFNVAWHLCGFGADPVLVSAVGDDEEGRRALDQMTGWGLSSRAVATRAEDPTGHVRVSIENDTPSYEIPPGQAWDHIPEPHLGAGSPALLYHGTLALRAPDSRSRLFGLRGRARAPVFVDLNLREPWWSEELVRDAVQGCAWVKASAEEVGELVHRPTASETECVEAARAFRETFDVERVIVTRGEQGSLLVGDAEPAVAPPNRVRDLVDTVGAGDAFSAVFCLGIMAGWDPVLTLERAGRFAADVCRTRGATSGNLSLYERHLRRWADRPAPRRSDDGLRILSLSIHGLVRGHDIELGRDADTGGQVSYVVDQARALVKNPEVDEVTLVTRLIEDKKVDDTYAAPHENLGGGARIVRLPFGPRRYQRKETLWPYLDGLLDQLTRWVRAQGRPPDVIHGHYADAGYVGARLSNLLGVPFLFTGHSLGRVKRARLLADGMEEETIEERYRISRRIEAEEQALDAADLVIASTHHEGHEQFREYENHVPERMRVIPPGVDLERFSPPPPDWDLPPYVRELERFLEDVSKPLILAIARPDPRKNFATLIEAYGRTPELREKANLAIVAGNRDDIREMSAAQRGVLTEILRLVDVFDLYGRVAYPKAHRPEDVPDLFRFAAYTKGVHVNAALTEPFGLTLLEAAATGLPVVATDDGGPKDILEACDHGLLCDPLDAEALGRTLLEALSSSERWGRWSKNGVARVHERFSWASHARDYVTAVDEVTAGMRHAPVIGGPTHLTRIDRLLVTDIDDTLLGDDSALACLMDRVRDAGEHVGFGVATGRGLEPTLEILETLGIETPDVVVTSSGADIRYGRRLIHDRSWERQIRHRWSPERIRETLDPHPGLVFDPKHTTSYRIRYEVREPGSIRARTVRRTLRKAGVHATAILDRGSLLDVLPVRASPGLALRFFGFKWNLPSSRILVAGDSGNDRDMLEGETLGVVVGNHTRELESLRDRPRVYFAEASHAWGVLEGIEHYDFFGAISAED